MYLWKIEMIIFSFEIYGRYTTLRQKWGSPVDGRGPPVQRQDGWVVDDGAVFGVVDDLHGDELGAEGHDVELGPHGIVGVPHLWEGSPLHPPLREFENRRPVLLGCHRWTRERRERSCHQTVIKSCSLQAFSWYLAGNKFILFSFGEPVDSTLSWWGRLVWNQLHFK